VFYRNRDVAEQLFILNEALMFRLFACYWLSVNLTASTFQKRAIKFTERSR
jgi:hypothetical protein